MCMLIISAHILTLILLNDFYEPISIYRGILGGVRISRHLPYPLDTLGKEHSVRFSRRDASDGPTILRLKYLLDKDSSGQHDHSDGALAVRFLYTPRISA